MAETRLLARAPIVLNLAAGPMLLRLAPETGGAVVGWWRDDVPLLRPTPAATGCAPSVRDHASFPLIPFSNRIAQGRFTFAGAGYTLPRDPRDPRHAMHGNALYAAWEVAAATAHSACLELNYTPGQANAPWFPFAYRARQHYRLSRHGMSIALDIRNADTRAFPAGLGHHLYFPQHDGARLRFSARGYRTTGAAGLPGAPADDLRERFAAGAVIGAPLLDNEFFGWDGRARIAYPRAGYSLYLRASPALRHAVLYTPPRVFFAFEPVSHPIDAINQPQAGGMRHLNPGEAMYASIGLLHVPLPGIPLSGPGG